MTGVMTLIMFVTHAMSIYSVHNVIIKYAQNYTVYILSLYGEHSVRHHMMNTVSLYGIHVITTA